MVITLPSLINFPVDFTQFSIRSRGNLFFKKNLEYSALAFNQNGNYRAMNNIIDNNENMTGNQGKLMELKRTLIKQGKPDTKVSITLESPALTIVSTTCNILFGTGVTFRTLNSVIF